MIARIKEMIPKKLFVCFSFMLYNFKNFPLYNYLFKYFLTAKKLEITPKSIPDNKIIAKT